jgi:hypothetical protein
MNSVKTTFSIKGNIAIVVVTETVHLDNSNRSVTTNHHLVEIPEGIIPTREYIIGQLHANK